MLFPVSRDPDRSVEFNSGESSACSEEYTTAAAEDNSIMIPDSIAPHYTCTDWEVFEGELDEQTLVISDYIQFCIDTLI